MRWIPVFLLAVVTLPSVGCKMFDKKYLDPNTYRDERAVDVDQRLSERKPIVESPF